MYTSMDLGRLCWTCGVAMGQYANQRLDEDTFQSLVRMQGKKTQKMYADLGIDHVGFSALQQSLMDTATSLTCPPEWAALDSHSVLFPGLLVHVCEYSETCSDVKVGRGGILLATSRPLSATEQAGVKTRVDRLVQRGKGDARGEGGRCHMSLLVETVMGYRGGSVAAADLLTAAPAPRARDRLNEMLRLGQMGLSPKLWWWTCAEVVEMAKQLQLLRQPLEASLAVADAVDERMPLSRVSSEAAVAEGETRKRRSAMSKSSKNSRIVQAAADHAESPKRRITLCRSLTQSKLDKWIKQGHDAAPRGSGDSPAQSSVSAAAVSLLKPPILGALGRQEDEEEKEEAEEENEADEVEENGREEREKEEEEAELDQLHICSTSANDDAANGASRRCTGSAAHRWRSDCVYRRCPVAGCGGSRPVPVQLPGNTQAHTGSPTRRTRRQYCSACFPFWSSTRIIGGLSGPSSGRRRSVVRKPADFGSCTRLPSRIRALAILLNCNVPRVSEGL